MLNQVVIVGRLTKDPELVKTESGKKVTTVTVAVPRSFKNTEGLYETDFLKCILWNAVAASTTEYCHKGDIIGVKGRLQNRTYEDEEKNSHTVTEIIAEKVTFLTSSNKNEEETN